MTRPARRTVATLVALVAAFIPASPAHACSTDDTSWFETFVDTSCLLAPTTNTRLEPLGGLRLSTVGTPVAEVWDTHTQFDAAAPATAVPMGVNTLVRSGTGPAARLLLPVNDHPLTRSDAVFGPPAASVDGDAVDDPAVVKVGGEYVMYYAGQPENGAGPAIFRATSTNGQTWTKDVGAGTTPVAMLEGGDAGEFDEHGVYAPDVTYDPADAVGPYRMYYTGRGRVFDRIGLATSTDGRTWTKYTGAGTEPVPVLDVGRPGSGDTFKVADPSVLKDGATWKMWYTGDDSNKLRISYATSPDGIVWSKGGNVIAPEDDDATGNTEFGVWAPTVWHDGVKYQMRLAGRKEVGGGDFQPKIMRADSPDGIDWSSPSPEVNQSGGSFYANDLDSPEVLIDGSTARLYFTGIALDAGTGLPVRRIGLDGFTSSVPGALGAVIVPTMPSATDAFDARQTSGVAAVKSGSTFVGAYSGRRNFDKKDRLGLATSTDAATWARAGGGGAFLALGGFDANGQRDPSLMLDGGTWHVYYTAVGSGIGHASAPDDAGKPGTWTKDAAALTNTASLSRPSVIENGAGDYWMYTTSAGGTGISRITSTTADFASPTTPAAVSITGTGVGAVSDPAVVKLADGSYLMAYTRTETVAGDTVHRVYLATSSNGTAWTEEGLWLAPSLEPFSYEERGVRPAGLLRDGTTLHLSVTGLGNDGRSRGGHASASTAAAGGPIPGAWSTYQFGGVSAGVRDFRSIVRASSATGAHLWMSLLQPYSSGASEYWSDFFPVTEDALEEQLSFFLNVRGVRWQARLDEPAAELDKVALNHAPVQFAATGSASTTPIAPPAGQATTQWTELTVGASTFTPTGSAGGTSGTVRILDAASDAELASMPVPASGEQTIPLSGISAAEHPQLRAKIDLASATGASTPIVELVKLRYNAAPISPPPPPPPVLTLAASAPVVTFGKSVTLSGALTQAGAGLGGVAVALAQQPVGAATPLALPAATTVAPAGAYTSTVKPRKHTTYSASASGAAAAPVNVQVRHRLTLKAARRGASVTLKGKIGPRHKRRPVVIQRKAGKRWVTFAKTRTNKRSRFRVRKSVKVGIAYRFRATTKADAQHLAGKSRVRKTAKR